MFNRILTVATVFAGCSFSQPGDIDPVADDTTTPPGDITLSIASGDHQTRVVGSELSEPLVVTAERSDHTPVENITINFSITGGGALSATSARTDVLGRAQTTLTLGTVAGIDNNTVSANALDIGTVNFVHSATPDVPAFVEALATNPMGVVGSQLADPFETTVRDRFGNLIEGVEVTFAVTGGGTASVPSAVTDALGQARVSLTLGTQAGTNTLEANVGSLAPAHFDALGVADVPTVLQVTGGATSATVATTIPTPLTATLRDQHGNPTPGITVSFIVTAGNGTVSTTNVITNAQGQAQTAWTLGPIVGTNKLEVRVTGLTTRELVASGTVGLAEDVAATSGNSQSGIVDNVLAPFVVTVQDGEGNVRPNTAVTFVVTANNGTLSTVNATTNAQGVAQTTLRLGTLVGTNVVEARVTGAGAAVFAATGINDVPFSIEAVSGNGQSKTVTSVLSPFIVVVKDKHGNPTPIAQVDFVFASGGGSLSSASVNTNGQGQAQTVLTLDSVARVTTVQARAAFTALTPAVFSATGTPGAPAQVQKSGDNQVSICDGDDLAAPLVVTVRDQFGNPTPGILVSFNALDGDGSGGCFPELGGCPTQHGIAKSTNSQGQVSVVYRNTLIGKDFTVTHRIQVTVANTTLTTMFLTTFTGC